MKLPDWYKGWIMANDKEISSRPPEYLYKAMLARKYLMRILARKIWFCLVDPEAVVKECLSWLDDLNESFKLTITQ